MVATQARRNLQESGALVKTDSKVEYSGRILVQKIVYGFELGKIDARSILGHEFANVSYEQLA